MSRHIRLACHVAAGFIVSAAAVAVAEPDEAAAAARPAKPANRELVSAALHLLARRDMTEREFVTKMTGKEFAKDDIAEISAWCSAEGFLSEARYTDINARRLSARYGARRVGATLKQKGVKEELIAETITQLAESDFARARALWLRKFGEPPVGATEKNKHFRFLQSRGFGFDVIKRVIAGEELEE